jgi:hypothetical protein
MVDDWDKSASLVGNATPRRSTSSLDDVARFTNRPLYLIAAVAIATMTSAYAVYRYLNGIAPGDGVFRLHDMVTAILLVSWLVTDPAIPSTQRPSFDHGMLVWVTFPLLAVYHMYSAHRWWGFLMVLGLLGLIAAPGIVLTLVHAVV